MNITLRHDVFRTFPRLKIGFILATQLDNKSKQKESLHLLQEAEKLIRLTFNEETIRNHHLLSPWRVARQEFGTKARHYHTSLERLLQDVLNGKSVAAKDVITNLVRYLSLKHLLPLAVDDAAKLQGKITFAIAPRRRQQVRKGDLYYHDEKKILGSKLDFWKNKSTGLHAGSTAALIHIEALPPLTSRTLKEVMAELEHLLYTFCRAGTKAVILRKARNAVRR